MIDSFLVFTPFLVFGIIALLGFVGCDVVLGLQHVPDQIPAPTGLMAMPGDTTVDLSWDASDNAIEYRLNKGTQSGVYDDPHIITAPTTSFANTMLTNGTEYFYTLSVKTNGGNSPETPEVSATPVAPIPTFQSFVTSVAPGTFQNQLSGWAGMVIQVGPNPIVVRTLGRMYGVGNINSHDVKIFDPAANADVVKVTVDVASGTLGKFTYTPLPNPVTLNAGFTYYVVSFELIGADHVYIPDTTVQTTNAATVTSAVTGSGQDIYTPTDGPGHTWGPLDFQY